jgi:hypothetical protein
MARRDGGSRVGAGARRCSEQEEAGVLAFSSVEPLLVPVVAGVVGAIGVAFKDTRLDRDQRSLRDDALADARAEVDFVNEWWKAHQLIGTGSAEATAKALAWLAEAEAKVLNTAELKSTPKPELTLRRLLLLEPMHRRAARVLRVLFLSDAALVLLGSAVTASDTASRSGHGQVLSDIGTLVFFAVLGLILRALAVASDKPPAAATVPSLGGQAPVAPPALPGPEPAVSVTGDPLVGASGDAFHITG